MAGNVVTSSANRNEELMAGGKFHTHYNIFCRYSLGNQRGLSIDHGVPDLPRFFISLLLL